MVRIFLWSFALMCISAGPAAPLAAQSAWPQFRGPTGDGHGQAATPPAVWSESQNIAWKTPIPGRGWSSPVVADNVVWMTSATVTEISDEEKERIRKEKLATNPMVNQMLIVGPVQMFAVGVDLTTGELIKTIPLFEDEDPEPVHSLNSYASPSPIIAGNRLYCHFGRFGTCAVDLQTGEVLWRTKLVIEHAVGPGSSPALYEDVLIVPCDGTDDQYVTGLDVNTGKQLWRTDRPPLSGTLGDLHKAYATPLVVNYKDTPQVITVGAQWFVSYEPRTGAELWRFHYGNGFSNVPRPVVVGDTAYLCTGFTTPECMAVRIDGRGDVTSTHEVWRYKRQCPTMSSPIVVDGAVYFVSDLGVLTCLDASSGERLYQQRLKGNYSSSPLYAGGKLYFCSREGETTVMKPGREYEELAVNPLAGQLMASPVALDNLLLVRSDSHLYRIEERPAAAEQASAP